jgi:hypothetical protein
MPMIRFGDFEFDDQAFNFAGPAQFCVYSSSLQGFWLAS